ncbi:hypothetical protein FGO68_gene11956 [Halteria grandinella]|uniref:Uncharacterized protein n=1 Tax=Halteria grandinella TaxID=5974 RepID=A0A8J8NSA4_HALGN|nr:hypothetical protein FGO68_gene11956 [Halteria grandinella]
MHRLVRLQMLRKHNCKFVRIIMLNLNQSISQQIKKKKRLNRLHALEALMKKALLKNSQCHVHQILQTIKREIRKCVKKQTKIRLLHSPLQLSGVITLCGLAPLI